MSSQKMFSIVTRSITSLYLPAVDNVKANWFETAKYIRHVFEKSGIAHIDAVAIESNGSHNRVYLNIKYWHDTENAHYFITRLKMSHLETRIIHDNEEELWWAVQVNKFQHKLYTPSKKRALVLFHQHDYDEISEYEEEKTDEEQKYSWVDDLLEENEMKKKYNYELSALHEDTRPAFY